MKSLLRYCVLLLMGLVVCTTACAADFLHPDILSFEQSVRPVYASKGSNVKLSNAHYKHGEQSLQWSWSKQGAYLTIHQPIAYEHKKTVNTDNSVYTFVFWMYLSEALTDSIRFEFRKQGEVCCWFNYGTQFTGWRGAWLAFRRDMHGKPEEGMDELRIYAPKGVKRGQLFLDHIILSSLQDVRHHTADFQAPYINPRSKSHWLVLLESWNKSFEYPLPKSISAQQKRDIARVHRRMEKELLGAKNAVLPLDSIEKRYAIYGLDKGKQGMPIFFERYGETYTHYDNSTTYSQKIGVKGLAKANALLLDIAIAYRKADDETEKERLAALFLSLTRHMLDQGFEAGSAMGTLHHLGYSMRSFYPAMYLMREVLANNGLQQRVQKAMEWFSGAGEVKTTPQKSGMDIDAFNTSLEGRLLSILMISDEYEQIRYLDALAHWIDNGFRYSDGLSGCFKPDGTIFHHCNHYPAYAVGGLTGAVRATWLLHDTKWAISQESHEILKQSLLAMRIYCNRTHWPLSLSGRHPDGKGHLIPRHFRQLAQCGSPDGSEKVDKELQAAYLRLVQKDNGFSESSPSGAWSFPYSCLQVQRRDDWMVAIKGHSRYIWNTETYERCNLYGRYLNYGNVQVLLSKPGQKEEGLLTSGYRKEGFDWSRIPGTTTAIVPIDSLFCRVNNLDVNSGFEEMLLSDESFCNGLSYAGNGIWGMKLHSHDKYDGTLRARKSVFCFGNRVICMGSGIGCEMDAPIETTMFQMAVTDAVNDSTAYLAQMNGVYPDGYGNYYITSDSVRWFEGMQYSRDEETMAPTQSFYRTASIVHGKNPKNATYLYTILVQADSLDVDAVHVRNSFEVLQSDDKAHIVRDKVSGQIGCVVYEKNALWQNTLPCLILLTPTEQGYWITVSDPDLHLYEGPSDETYDENGKRKERIIYSYPWKDAPSKPSEIGLTIANQSYVFPCQHGMASSMQILPCGAIEF